MKKNKLSEVLLTMIYVCLSGFGMLFAFADAFEISYEKDMIYLAGVIFGCALVLALSYIKKYRIGFATMFGITACFSAFVFERKAFIQSLQQIGYAMEEQLRAYYLGEHDAFKQGVSKLPNAGGLFLVFITITLSVYGIVCCKRAWGTLVTIGLVSALPFFTGEVLKMPAIVCFTVVLFGSAFAKIGGAQGEQRKKSEWIGIAAGALAVVVAVSVIQFPVKKMFAKSDIVKEKLDMFWDEKILGRTDEENLVKGDGGVSNGQLGKFDEIVPGEELHLKVRLQKKPKERIYLQGYIGDRYTGTNWDEAEQYHCSGWLYDRGYVYKEFGAIMTDVRNLSYHQFEKMAGDMGSEKDILQVEWYVGADAHYLYRPYISLYKSLEESNKRETVTDTYLPSYMEKKYSFPYYPYSLLDSMEVPEESSGLEKDYEEYVSNVYEVVDENVRAAFEPIVNQEIQATDVEEMRKEIADLLKDHTVYSLKPGKTPEGEDFAEYFFFQNKKGYCTHYATVATLMFRMKNVPARYVSGYVIEPNEFQKEKDGSYVAEVTGKSAHAWAEVYKHGKGWLPAETTPRYTRGVPRQTNPVTPEAQEPVKNKTPEQEKQKEKEQEEKNFSGAVAAGISGIGIFTAILYLRYKKYNRKKYMNRRKGDYNIKIKSLFYKIWAKLISEKIVDKNTELDLEFVQKMCQRYESISEEDVICLLEIVYRANFGKEKLGAAEYGFLQTILEKIE